jgi:outer membrane protein assembly factor BamB
MPRKALLDKGSANRRGGSMSLTARCHSLRPDRTSGWLTYFELNEQGSRAGHFLVVGPGVARQPENIQAALRAGQAAVRYLKEVPANAPPLTLLEATARILDHESKGGTDLEFGCAVLEGHELWLLTRGAVRLVALSPEPGVPFGAGRPHAVSVGRDERYFLGRVPETVEAASSEELRARLERGGGDGGLVVRLAASDRLQAVAASEDEGETVIETIEPRAAASSETKAPPGESPKTKVEPPAPKVEAPAAKAEPPAPKTESSAANLEAMSSGDTPSKLLRRIPVPRKAPPTTPSTGAGATPNAEAPAPRVVPKAPEKTPGSAPPPASPTVALDLEDAEKPPRIESRGLGFWLGIVAAFFALSALIVYLVAIRPHVRKANLPNAPQKTTTPPDSLHGALLAPTLNGPLRVAWQARFADAVSSSPVIAGDRVVFGCRDGNVYALRATNGDSLWAFAAKDGFGASPIRCGNMIVIGSYEGTVYAIDLFTGASRWSVPTQGRIVASAVCDSTSVYVGSYDHRLYAITLADGNVRWTRDLGGVLWASPAASDGQVIAAGLDGRVSAVDAATGRVRWSASLGGPIYSSPALGEGRIFVGTRGGDVVALDARTGAVAWKVDAGGAVNGAAAYRHGWVVVGNEAGEVLGILSETGRVEWRVKTKGEVRSRPAFSEDRVWVTGYDGWLRSLELRSGKEAAALAVGSSIFSSPAIGIGAVYFGALDGRFFSVEPRAPAS